MKNAILGAAAAALLVSACTSPKKRTAVGAGTGAAVGAGVGAVLGHQSGKRDKGAAIGAGVGAMIGGGIGNYLDRQAKELAEVAETRRTDEGIITTLKNNVLFDTNSSALKQAAMDDLSRLGQIISKYPEDRIVVVGHTDNRGDAAFNERLSLQRAQAVKLQLINNGVPAASVETLGQGESQPVASNTEETGRSQNRRVELHITVDQAKVQQESQGG